MNRTRQNCLPSSQRPVLLRWLAVLVLGSLLGTLALTTSAAAGDPTNKAQCLSRLRSAIESRCEQMFSEAEQKTACLQQVGSQVEQTCNQFFGEGTDFCASCTSSCTQNFDSATKRRKECLSMCLRQRGCQ